MSSDYIPGTEMRARAAEPAPDEPIVEASTQAAPTLMIAAPSPTKPQLGTLFWLSHIMGLDTYGCATLSYAARVDMNAAALVLASIFLFDLAAWSLLFYFIVNSGSIEFNPARIIFAAGGILPAMALFLYERSFMTADTKSHGWRRLLLPTIIRLGVILAAAWITAQPVELLTFGQRIKDHVHQELIRKNIVHYYRQMKDAQAKQGNAPGAGSAMVAVRMKQLEKAEADLKQVSAQSVEIKAQLNSATNREHVANDEVEHLRKSIRDHNLKLGLQQDPNKDPAVISAMSKRDKLRGEVSQLTVQLGKLDGDKQRSQTDVNEINRQLLPEAEVQQSADTAQKSLDNWVKTLQNLAPGTSPLPQGDYNFTFVDYDFLDKFRVIDDVLAGRPPRWPGADQKMIADLKHQYGMYDLTDSEVDVISPDGNANAAGNVSQKIGIDPEAQERNLAEIRNAKRIYWAIFGVAAIIPLLSLLFKLIMPSHLAYYYSSVWQAQQGNPWAMAMEAGIASMKDYRVDRKIAHFPRDNSGGAWRNGNFPPERTKRK